MTEAYKKEFFELDREYKKRFGTNCQTIFSRDPVALLKKCLKEGKPFDPYEGIPKKDRDKVLF